MQATQKYLEDTKLEISVTADAGELQEIKKQTLQVIGKDMKVPGFRPGKAPEAVIERNANPTVLQSEFLERAVNQLYSEALSLQRVRAVERPEISITKFVPFTDLEFKAELQVIGEVKLADYKKLSVKKPPVNVTKKDVDEVIGRMRAQTAEKKEVKRAAKDGDEVVMNFSGVDAKTKEPIAGADGKDYPLVLGSNSFIPGFEPELIGLKAGESKTFDITFPKDYGAKELQSKKVTFTCEVLKVNELKEPALDDAFAKKAGPFDSLKALEEDVKKQLKAEGERRARGEFENEIVSKLAEETTVAIPDSLIDDQVASLEQEEKKNIGYRGIVWEDYLKEEKLTEESYHEKKRPEAIKQLKISIVLSEVADKEQLMVTPEELDVRIQLLKGQYSDPAMHAELDKSENRRDVFNRLLTEKTLDKLTTLVDAPAK